MHDQQFPIITFSRRIIKALPTLNYLSLPETIAVRLRMQCINSESLNGLSQWIDHWSMGCDTAKS